MSTPPEAPAVDEASALAFEVVRTREGAKAILDRVTGEVMHPVVGPRVEAERLYVGPSRLRERLRAGTEDERPLVLLDVGLGAGSNALAAFEAAELLPRGSRRLTIVSFDKTAGALACALAHEHAADFGYAGRALEAAAALLAVGKASGERVAWRYVEGDLPGTLSDIDGGFADIVFWDPFSPRANPDLWTVAAFRALRRVSADGATVHTYSGATAVRAAMLLAGFAVGLGDVIGTSPPSSEGAAGAATSHGAASGKRATVAATHAASLVEPLDARWLERLARSPVGLPRDAPEDAHARIRACSQFGRPSVEGLA